MAKTPTHEEFKRTALRDLLQRLIANPHNLDRVVKVIASNWNPTISIDGKSKRSVSLGENYANFKER